MNTVELVGVLLLMAAFFAIAIRLVLIHRQKKESVPIRVPILTNIRLEICQFNVDPDSTDPSTIRYYLRRIKTYDDGSQYIHHYKKWGGHPRTTPDYEDYYWLAVYKISFDVFDDFENVKKIYLMEYSILARQYKQFNSHAVNTSVDISTGYTPSPKSPEDELFELGDTLRKNNVPTALPPVSNMNL